MTYEAFMLINKKLEKQSKLSKAVYKLGIDLSYYEENCMIIISSLMKEIYGEEGYDWWSWFVYECEFGTKQLEANDENGKPICYSWESLYEYLKQYDRTNQ